MRTDTAAWRERNLAASKDPRYTIELAFDSDNTILAYLTSHADCATPGGGTVIAGVVEGIAGTSQGLDPDKAVATIGAISFRVVDKGAAVTSQLGAQIQLGRSTRQQRVRVYMGFEGLAFADYTLVATQIVDEIGFDDGLYTFRCADIQRAMRKEIFELAVTSLAASIDEDDDVVQVHDTSRFEMLAHGPSYSDAPNQTVGYFKLGDEVIRYTGKTPTAFTGCTRGALNTRAVAHSVDPNASADRQPKVEEYVYLEMPGPKLAYALLTGKLLGQGDATLPSNWHLGIESGRAFDDHSGNGLDAALSGPILVKGPRPNTEALRFDGIDDIAEVPYDPSFDFERTDAFTLFARVRIRINDTNDVLIDHRTADDNGYAIALSAVDRKLIVIIGHFPLGRIFILSDAAVSPDEWHTVGFTYDGSSAAAGVTIYLDGVATTGTVLDDTLASSITSPSPLRFGVNGMGTSHLEGDLSEAVIYGRKLSAQEMADLHHGQPVDGSSLVGHWVARGGGFVREADYTSIGADLWDPDDDTAGFVTHFQALEKQDGKAFLEKELMLLMGAYMPVGNDGRLGLRRMANVLAGAAYVAMLDESNVVSYGELVHDFKSLHNQIQIDWNYEPAEKRFTRSTGLLDQDSIVRHGKAEPLKLAFRGLHGSRHSSAVIAQRFDAIRDRYSGPPLRLSVKGLPSLNTLEVGDIVRVKLDAVRDFVANGSLDRSFEVQRIAIDWVRGDVSLTLFASSQAPGALAPTADATVLPQAWYEAQGTELSTVLTITGSNPGHISANGDLPAGDYYYIGDLVLDAGVTVTLNGTVRLFVMGHLTLNGELDGKGRGHAGAAQVAPIGTIYDDPDYAGHIGAYNDGTSGFLGSPRSGGGMVLSGRVQPIYEGYLTPGANPTVPSFALAWDGSTLAGLPADLRGSSGASGHNTAIIFYSVESFPGSNIFRTEYYYARGGAGGAGGAGLVTVARGVSFGGSGAIDLSGDNGALGEYVAYSVSRQLYAGSGAGGAPGGWLCVLDGNLANVPSLGSTFVADYGATPIAGNLVTKNTKIGDLPQGANTSYRVGTGDGTTFALPSLSGARGGARIQFVPGESAIEADPAAQTLLPPGSLTLASGTAELLGPLADGTVVARIKATWSASPDERTLGYEVQYKESASSLWINAPVVLGKNSTTTYLGPVREGIEHDVRVRAAGDVRRVSEWLTVIEHEVIGKTQPPSDVGPLSFDGVDLSWPAIPDRDRLGYEVRVGDTDEWDEAQPAHGDEFITDTEFDTRKLVGGQKYLMVKAIDYTRRASANASSLLVDLRPPKPDRFLITRQPDGTREIVCETDNPPDDLKGFKVRYYLGETDDWDAMTPLHDGVQPVSPWETNQLAAGTYTLAAKNEDEAGNESAEAIFMQVVLGDPRVADAVADINEAPTWTGARTNCELDGATGWLVASGTGQWGDVPAQWSDWTQWETSPAGSMQYTRAIDIGVKTKFVPYISVTGDGTITIEERHSDDGMSWSSFAAAGPQLDARYIEIRVTVTGSYPKLKTMRSILSAQTISESIEDLDTSALTGSYRIGVGDIRLPLTKSYSVIKHIRGFTLQSVGPGWSWSLVDKSVSPGPRIKIYDGAGNPADAVIDAEVVGLP